MIPASFSIGKAICVFNDRDGKPESFRLHQQWMGLSWMMKDLEEKKAKRGSERASPAKWKKIQERAGELAMNRGKRAHEADKKEMQRAKRELLDMHVSSPKVLK